MSGGSLNYFYGDLENHIGDFGDRELDDLVKDLARLFHDREWFLSSDTGEGSWNEARDAFKAKWFGDGTRQERIEQYLDEIKAEVMAQFGVSNRYCKNCKNWTQDKRDNYEKYGDCSRKKNVLMHRSESCDKFEEKEEDDEN